MKMYILVREGLSSGVVAVACAHASLACYLKFRDHPDVAKWLSGPFWKIVCKVTDFEFQEMKKAEDHVVITESSLEDAEVAIAFRPRAEWHKSFGYLPLYRG